MALKLQTFFLRLGLEADTYLVRPGTYLSVPVWTQQRTLGTGVYSRYMGPLKGSAQVAASNTWGTVPDPSTVSLGFAQFLSDPLQRQSVASGVWQLAFGAILTNAAFNFAWEGQAALFVINGMTGAVRSTVFNAQGIGGFRADADARTVFQPVLGQAFELFTGDYLALEVGIVVNNNGAGATVPAASLLCDGTTAITADNQPTASAMAALYAPVPFTLSVPQPGELPGASVSFDEAVSMTQRMWPGSTFHDFNDPTSPDAEFLAWMAQVFKTNGWDVWDLMEREMDPSRAILKLQDWRELYSMSQNPPNPEQLRALVIARLREFVGPSNPFNVAAAVGVVLGYADPQQLELLEISAATLRAQAEYTDDLGGTPIAIPVDTDFDTGTNLTRRTPFIMDGGAVWESGALLTLRFNMPAGQTIRARLRGPDRTEKIWAPLTLWDPVSTLVLYAKEFAGKAVHGNWQLDLFRTAAPAASLLGWSLYAPGAPRAYVGPTVTPPTTFPQPKSVPNVVRGAGLGQWKFWWGAFADPRLLSQKVDADFGAARQALSRLRHGYQKADLILSKKPIPDKSTTLPDACVPWDGLPF